MLSNSIINVNLELASASKPFSFDEAVPDVRRNARLDATASGTPIRILVPQDGYA